MGLVEFIKYRTRQLTISYSKKKLAIEEPCLTSWKENYVTAQKKCDAEPSTQNTKEFESLKADYDNF